MSSSVALTRELRFRDPRGLEGFFARSCRELVLKAFDTIIVGRITLRDSHGTYEFGTAKPGCDLHARVVVFDPKSYVQVALRGGVGAGESWMEDRWACDDLTALARILLRNEGALKALHGPLSKLGMSALKHFQRLRRNTVNGSRRNIAAHYDLGNEFYRLWLDDTLTYSCGIFADHDQNLQNAQHRKYDAIAEQLQLSDQDSVLEIGCGWGGFAVFVAESYGCHVTATTISREQYRVARERVRKAGLGDRVEVLLQDYRKVDGKFDKVVSIEMFEAVGHEYHNAFFTLCAERMRIGGRMLLQTITIEEDRYKAARHRTDFIQRYIFPGGALPSDRSLAQAVSRVHGLSLIASNEIGPHYATTLRQWRERFAAVKDAVTQMGFDERFMRMWDFYLCYCEAGFHERSIGTVQALIERTSSTR